MIDSTPSAQQTDITRLPDGRQLILASSSPYRRELLARLDLPFIAQSPQVDETALPDESAPALTERLARDKAQAVASLHPHSLVIGSDQLALLDQQILGKPGNHTRAVQQLRAASGKVVTFYTGLCLIDSDSGRIQSEVIPFKVWFRDLTDSLIERYLCRETPYQCAGSFKSEGLGIVLFRRLEGDDPNALVGLPLIRLVDMLIQENINIP